MSAKSLLKVSPPALWKGVKLNGAAQQLHIMLIADIESCDVADCYVSTVLFDQLDLIASFHLAFLEHRKIEARAPARQKFPDDIRTSKANAQFVARHTRLSNHYQGG